jgi:hypothetical protein
MEKQSHAAEHYQDTQQRALPQQKHARKQAYKATEQLCALTYLAHRFALLSSSCTIRQITLISACRATQVLAARKSRSFTLRPIATWPLGFEADQGAFMPLPVGYEFSVSQHCSQT